MRFFKNLFYKPLSTQLTVTSSSGFHLRPVARFTSLAKSFSCDITASLHSKSVDAKKVNALLSLSLEKNDTFTLTTQGKEAQKALTALHALFATLMHDDVEVTTLTKEHTHYKGETLGGDIITKGVAIAPASAYRVETLQHENTLTFKDAIEKTIKNLEETYNAQKESSNADIYLAQNALLSALADKCDTLEALEAVVAEESSKLQDTKLSAKITDYQDILQQVKTALGLEVKVIFPKHDFILLANDLLPSEIALLSDTQVQGVILKETSINSHTAILLRASGIPSLIADTSGVPLNADIILDSFSGAVVLRPSSQDIQTAKDLQNKHKKDKAYSAAKRFESAQTTQGKFIKVYANVADVPSAKLAKEEGAEGIGLLRSEFLFTEQRPSLEVQTNAYREIFSFFDDVTVRTLDVGGDKALPYIRLPKEANPFLGVRGVRLFQTHPDILSEQLHAIFLAASKKSIKIMFPMVSTVKEFVYAKQFALDVASKHQLSIDNILFGMMIEVPSTLFTLAEFDAVVDFYSVGTNDLTQYLFAIERTHPTLSIDTRSPILFKTLAHIVNAVTKPVSICGELASDTKAIPELVNLGFTTLSVTPKGIAQTKEIIRHV